MYRQPHVFIFFYCCVQREDDVENQLNTETQRPVFGEIVPGVIRHDVVLHEVTNELNTQTTSRRQEQLAEFRKLQEQSRLREQAREQEARRQAEARQRAVEDQLRALRLQEQVQQQQQQQQQQHQYQQQQQRGRARQRQKKKQKKRDYTASRSPSTHRAGVPGKTIDLHNLSVHDAMMAVISFINNKEQEYNDSEYRRVDRFLYVITGRGRHSKGGIPKIKPAVEGYLQKHDYTHTWDEPGGMVTIDLLSKRHK
ncbi:probable serine/threonine-protein kinase irlF [Physella acuta]|uniref:probable serine/threonine-protein kinase irlF n=1 Tax=Physella acuta TaxID=109671 RepID=UPI0027DE10FC|nr:probable serine/threonine-protein kinase irlF [Physella acuta]